MGIRTSPTFIASLFSAVHWVTSKSLFCRAKNGCVRACGRACVRACVRVCMRACAYMYETRPFAPVHAILNSGQNRHAHLATPKESTRSRKVGILVFFAASLLHTIVFFIRDWSMTIVRFFYHTVMSKYSWHMSFVDAFTPSLMDSSSEDYGRFASILSSKVIIWLYASSPIADFPSLPSMTRFSYPPAATLISHVMCT